MRIAAACRTTSNDTLLKIVGLTPIELLARESTLRNAHKHEKCQASQKYNNE